MRRLIALFLSLTVSCTVLSQQSTGKDKSLSILFVGNSLTYTNNLPALVERYSKEKGVNVSTEMIAFPNYAIEDHWKDGTVKKLISSKKYDYVIIQQGPSSQQEGRKMLIDYGKKYSKLCKRYGTQLCYFMVWPSLYYYQTFDAVVKNHTDAAAINNAILLPVGRAWQDYISATGKKHYYSSDGFHPSIKGSEVSAQIIVAHLFK